MTNGIELAVSIPQTFPDRPVDPGVIRKYLARAGKRLTEWFGGFYGRPQMAEEVSIWGTPAECVDGLAQVAAAGARMLVLNPVFDEMEHLEYFASEIAPKV